MGMIHERDGVYVLEIYHQSGKVSTEHYENRSLAWQGYQMQCQCYGKRKLKLYAIACSSYASGTLLAAHNFPGLEGELQKRSHLPAETTGGKYLLEIYHQSGKVTETTYKSQASAKAEFEFQQQHYGKRKLKLYVFSDAHPELKLIASH